MLVVASPEASPTPSPPAARLAFTSVYRKHAGFVWRTLRALGVPEASMDDALQEVFLVVYRRLATFEGRSSLTTWLYAISYRTSLHHRRAAARKPTCELPDELPWQGPGPGEQVQGEQAGRFVMQFLDTVSAEKRDVFSLCVLEELPVTEAAEILGVKLNTVYSRLRLVRADFRKALAQLAQQKERS